jgi:hypothetical protein
MDTIIQLNAGDIPIGPVMGEIPIGYLMGEILITYHPGEIPNGPFADNKAEEIGDTLAGKGISHIPVFSCGVSHIPVLAFGLIHTEALSCGIIHTDVAGEVAMPCAGDFPCTSHTGIIEIPAFGDLHYPAH